MHPAEKKRRGFFITEEIFFRKPHKKALTTIIKRYIIKLVLGGMAQLVERLVRNEEASGSNPLSSTKTKHAFVACFLFWWLIVYTNR